MRRRDGENPIGIGTAARRLHRVGIRIDRTPRGGTASAVTAHPQRDEVSSVMPGAHRVARRRIGIAFLQARQPERDMTLRPANDVDVDLVEPVEVLLGPRRIPDRDRGGGDRRAQHVVGRPKVVRLGADEQLKARIEATRARALDLAASACTTPTESAPSGSSRSPTRHARAPSIRPLQSADVPRATFIIPCVQRSPCSRASGASDEQARRPR